MTRVEENNPSGKKEAILSAPAYAFVSSFLVLLGLRIESGTNLHHSPGPVPCHAHPSPDNIGNAGVAVPAVTAEAGHSGLTSWGCPQAVVLTDGPATEKGLPVPHLPWWNRTGQGERSARPRRPLVTSRTLWPRSAGPGACWPGRRCHHGPGPAGQSPLSPVAQGARPGVNGES